MKITPNITNLQKSFHNKPQNAPKDCYNKRKSSKDLNLLFVPQTKLPNSIQFKVFSPSKLSTQFVSCNRCSYMLGKSAELKENNFLWRMRWNKFFTDKS